jgi:hypothetical protein
MVSRADSHTDFAQKSKVGWGPGQIRWLRQRRRAGRSVDLHGHLLSRRITADAEVDVRISRAVCVPGTGLSRCRLR